MRGLALAVLLLGALARPAAADVPTGDDERLRPAPDVDQPPANVPVPTPRPRPPGAPGAEEEEEEPQQEEAPQPQAPPAPSDDGIAWPDFGLGNGAGSGAGAGTGGAAGSAAGGKGKIGASGRRASGAMRKMGAALKAMGGASTKALDAAGGKAPRGPEAGGRVADGAAAARSLASSAPGTSGSVSVPAGGTAPAMNAARPAAPGLPSPGQPKALTRRPDFFQVLTPRRYEKVTAAFKAAGAAPKPQFKDIGLENGMDFAWTRSCDRVSGDCTTLARGKDADGYAKGEDVSPETLDAVLAAIDADNAPRDPEAGVPSSPPRDNAEPAAAEGEPAAQAARAAAFAPEPAPTWLERAFPGVMARAPGRRTRRKVSKQEEQTPAPRGGPAEGWGWLLAAAGGAIAVYGFVRGRSKA